MAFRPDGKIFAEDAKTGELLEFPNPSRGWGLTLEQTGGKPPMDWMNGAFHRIDLNQQFQSLTGVHYPFNQAFCDAIGGYPKGSILLSTDGATLYQSSVDANTTDPDAGGAGWSRLIPEINIATEEDIDDGAAGKLVDAAGLKEYEESKITTIYPNGGSEASPANIVINQRYTETNPFPGEKIRCQLQAYINGQWGDLINSMYPSIIGGNSYAVGCVFGQLGDGIIIQTAKDYLMHNAAIQGNIFSTNDTKTAVPVRMIVEKL